MRLTRSNGSPEWLCGIVKTAAHSPDLQALMDWNASPGDLGALRALLGRVFANLSEISNVFKQGSRSPTPDMAQRARAILPELADLNGIAAAAEQTVARLKSMPEPAARMLERLAHGIAQARLSQDQAQQFEAIASGSTAGASMFVEETDPQRMNNFLRQSIYSGGNDQEKTIKVLRELLQNATDAAKQKQSISPETKPSIDIVSESHEDMTDLMVTDNGIGMDWNVMSEKFFRYFASGKEGEEGATGGYGIAKALIQETPKHGWTIDSNNLHSSKFGRNMWLGTRRDQEFQPARPHVSASGTTMTLFGLPKTTDYSLRAICQVYAISGVGITFNGDKIDPLFDMSQSKKLGDNLEGLSASVGQNEAEKEVAEGITQKVLSTSSTRLGDMKWEHNGKFVEIQFSTVPSERWSSNIYVLLNGQYQFHNSMYMEKISILCDVRTNSRPGEDMYPLDPGRANLREPYKARVDETMTLLRTILEQVAKHDLFKDGLNIKMYNQGFKPMAIADEDDEAAEAERRRFSDVVSANLDMLFPEDKPAATEQIVAVTADKMANEMQLSPQQRAILSAGVMSMIGARAKRIDVQNEVSKIIDGLMTPAAMMVQKNFVSQDVANNPDLTANLMILWQSIIKRVTDKSAKLLRDFNARRNRKYVPGMLFSNEANAVYRPAEERGGYDTIALNPIAIAALVQPEMFEEKLKGGTSQRVQPTPPDEAADAKAADRLAAYLLHVATHEVTHLLFPDTYTSDEDAFHKKVTYVEMASHFLYPEIRQDVKKHWAGLRKDMRKLVTHVSRDLSKPKKQASIGAWLKSNCVMSRPA